jgi:hypothetical protein
MSSSRSITAARNRRAGDAPQQQVSRPNTSIGSSNVFSQQPRVSTPQPKPPHQQQRSFQQPQVDPQQHVKPRISVGDAIGLTTIRLCKVENFINELKENGGELPANSQIVDNSVLTSLINRLDSLEKKEIANSERIKQLENELENFTKESGDKFADFELAIVELEKQLPEAEEHDQELQQQEKDQDTVANEIQVEVHEELLSSI